MINSYLQLNSVHIYHIPLSILLLLLSRFSRVQLCATPWMAAHQAPPSLGFSRQEHWNGLPFTSPMHEREKWKWSRSVMSSSWQPHGLQPTRLLRPWDFPGKSAGVGAITFSADVLDPRYSNIFMTSSGSLLQAQHFRPREAHGQQSLVGYSPWGRKELNTTEAT